MMSDKPQLATLLAPAARGLARVEHFDVNEAEARLHNMRCVWDPKRTRDTISPGKYAALYVGKVMMMSDTDMEWRTNQGVLGRATGDVLIAGLGLGMILPPLLAKREVASVTVVEKYPDVIALVAPTFKSRKLTVVEADIFTMPLRPGAAWDTIYFDIWPEITEANLSEMTRLKRRYARRLRRSNPGAWMGCWREADLRYWRNR
jgi:hypothetical protein